MYVKKNSQLCIHFETVNFRSNINLRSLSMSASKFRRWADDKTRYWKNILEMNL